MCEAEDAIIDATILRCQCVIYIRRQKLSFANWIKLNAVEIVFASRSVQFGAAKVNFCASIIQLASVFFCIFASLVVPE